MQLHFISIWKLMGLNRIADGCRAPEWSRSGDPRMHFLITNNISIHCQHADMAAAIGQTVLRSFLRGDPPGDMAPKLSAVVAQVSEERIRHAGEGVFLVASSDITVAPDLRCRKDDEKFAFCFDAIDKNAVRAMMQPSVDSGLAAVLLALPEKVASGVMKVADSMHLLETDSDKPIYSINLAGGTARMTLSTPLTPEIVASPLMKDTYDRPDTAVARAMQLLIMSLESSREPLQSYLDAWMALEVFVNMAFRNNYEARAALLLMGGVHAPDAATKSRILREDGKRPHLADKFLVLARALSPASAATDAPEFNSLKMTRDNFLHKGEMPLAFPTEAIQRLLVRYIRLHITASATNVGNL